MVRILFASLILGLVAVTAGCSMCSHPYDDCGPLFTGGCDGNQCTGPRAGSIRAMEGTVASYYEDAVPGEMVPYVENSDTELEVPEAPAVPPMQMQSRRSRPQGVMPWNRNGRAGRQRQVSSDVRRMIPQADRQSAQVLSVTDETLAEAQARRAGSAAASTANATAGQPPDPLR